MYYAWIPLPPKLDGQPPYICLSSEVYSLADIVFLATVQMGCVHPMCIVLVIGQVVMEI